MCVEYLKMASHFKWYPASEEVIVPWNARYSFPSQANKAMKTTPRIPPKNGSLFNPGDTLRVEFPAQGYVNPNNTTISFDVDLSGFGTLGTNSYTRFQNGIASIFSRIRLMYGSTPLEDIINANVIVRMLNEHTTTSDSIIDQTSIMAGLGGSYMSTSGQMENARQRCIHGVATQVDENTDGCVPNQFNDAYPGYSRTARRRYQIQFPLGLFTQSKLIPTKFMASQLAIEMTLAPAASCIIGHKGDADSGALPAPTYRVLNVNLIPEVLEFDASYDASFLKGLQDGGV